MWTYDGEQGKLVYIGPDNVSDTTRRAHTAGYDMLYGVAKGAELAIGSAKLPIAGMKGAKHSAGRAFKAAKRKEIVKATGHAACATVKPVAGLIGGVASLTASPFPIIAGAGTATYNVAMMAMDRGKKAIIKENFDQREEGRSKNVGKMVRHLDRQDKHYERVRSTVERAKETISGQKQSVRVTPVEK